MDRDLRQDADQTRVGDRHEVVENADAATRRNGFELAHRRRDFEVAPPLAQNVPRIVQIGAVDQVLDVADQIVRRQFSEGSGVSRTLDISA